MPGVCRAFRFSYLSDFLRTDMPDDLVVFDDVDSVTVRRSKYGAVLAFEHGKNRTVIEAFFVGKRTHRRPEAGQGTAQAEYPATPDRF